jgi:Domain of unknown function (DUF6933)
MLDLLGRRNVTLSEPTPSDDDWYLNLVWLERQKCLLLTHSGTLFSVFRPASVSQISDRYASTRSTRSRQNCGRNDSPPRRSRGLTPTTFESRRPRAETRSHS